MKNILMLGLLILTNLNANPLSSKDVFLEKLECIGSNQSIYDITLHKEFRYLNTRIEKTYYSAQLDLEDGQHLFSTFKVTPEPNGTRLTGEDHVWVQFNSKDGQKFSFAITTQSWDDELASAFGWAWVSDQNSTTEFGFDCKVVPLPIMKGNDNGPNHPCGIAITGHSCH